MCWKKREHYFHPGIAKDNFKLLQVRAGDEREAVSQGHSRGEKMQLCAWLCHG